jgi:hypothetical protein
MNSVGQLSKTGTDPQRLSGWFLHENHQIVEVFETAATVVLQF